MSSSSFKELLGNAIDVTNQKLAVFPKYGVYIHAMEQLVLIRTIISQTEKPTKKQKDMINIGFMAVRELETSDPGYCDILCEIDEIFKKL